jgi:hypothetical protein
MGVGGTIVEAVLRLVSAFIFISYCFTMTIWPAPNPADHQLLTPAG